MINNAVRKIKKNRFYNDNKATDTVETADILIGEDI
jgi:hypothetical protein